MRYNGSRSLGCFLALCVPLVSANSLAATLTADEVRGVPYQINVGVPVSLTSDASEYVSAVQFDLLFDASVLALSAVEAGEAAIAANKEVVFSDVAAGRVRVMVSGINQDVIPDGVVACARVGISPDASRGVYAISLANTSCCDQFGDVVISDGTAGSIIVIDDWPPEGATSLRGLRGGVLCATCLVIAVLYPCVSGVSQTRRGRTRTRLGKDAQGRV